MAQARLFYHAHRVKKNGNAALYLRIILKRETKDFPLKLEWPTDKIDLTKQLLLPRKKKDDDVNDYNLIIECEKAKFAEIQRTYRLRQEEITIEKLTREVKIYDTRECFTSYMEQERNRRYKRREIELKTWQNAHATKMAILRYEPICLFSKIDVKWMKGFKIHLQNAGYKPGTIWSRLSCLKAYLRLADAEPSISVNPGIIDFPNPKTIPYTVYLTRNELNEMFLLLERDLTNRQMRCLKAFLFTCFTGLRISDLYRAKSKWEVEEGFLSFVPAKNYKKAQLLKIPLIPMARALVSRGQTYFDLPNRCKYNQTLKELAEMAGISKNVTAHVGRHTFGLLYMESAENIYGLQKLLGHTKLETTERYAHVSDAYKMESTLRIQKGFEKHLSKPR